MIDKQELLDILTPVHQEHVLKYWDSLSEESRASLATQIRQVNWGELEGYIASASQTLSPAELQAITPAPYLPLQPKRGDEMRYEEARAAGEALLRDGKVGVFTVAGGQGSRLGFAGPKGTFPLSEIKQKTLFQLFAEKLLYIQNKYGRPLRWYLMTSVANHADTCAFFAENGYFGLDAKNIRFFSQGMLPALDATSHKALLAAPDSLALAPNGHGGSFAALKDSGALDDMKAQGITTITYFQVDNPLVRPFDPLFLGLHELTASDMSSRALIKRDAKEKLGHFCNLNGKTIIIEYSDMPEELVQKRDADGQLSFRAGSPAIHLLRRTFVEEITAHALKLPAHSAIKKIPCLNQEGVLVQPQAPNALKLEFFLFDALPLAKNPLIFEANREENFAPVKNAEGNDSPASSRAALNARSARLFQQAGLPFPLKADGTPDAVVEISERAIQTPQELRHANPPALHPGDKLYLE